MTYEGIQLSLRNRGHLRIQSFRTFSVSSRFLYNYILCSLCITLNMFVNFYNERIIFKKPFHTKKIDIGRTPGRSVGRYQQKGRATIACRTGL